LTGTLADRRTTDRDATFQRDMTLTSYAGTAFRSESIASGCWILPLWHLGSV
jgi:hypothetical protein